MTRVDKSYPKWMLSDPDPRPEPRKFNMREFIGWEGRVTWTELEGWTDNPRLDMPVERFKEENAGRGPTNDELLEIMIDNSVGDRPDDEDGNDDEIDSRRSRKNKLLELAESIKLNGVRVPLIVTHDKRILDGNRRYFATLYLYKTTDDKDEREKYSTLPVWVLPKGTPPEDENRVLTELNSINDCYVRWPYSVVARRIFQDYKNGATVDDLQRKYHDWSKSRITTVIEAYKVAAEFIEHHDDSIEARDLVYRKLIWFDELRRSNNRAMAKVDFRNAIYDLILQANSPFTSARDFKRLGEIYENPEAWETLTTHQGKESLRQAHFVLDRDRYEGKSNAESRMSRVNSLLKGIIDGPGFGLVEVGALTDFHKLAKQVPGARMDFGARAEQLIDLLDGLTSKEIAQLPASLKRKIGSSLDRVKKQADSFQG